MQVANRGNGDRHEIGWLKAVILVVAWLIIISLAKDVWQIRTGFNRITESERRLVAEEARQSNLKQKLELVQTPAYKEKLIREKLNMQKIGEVIVVMPKNGSLTTVSETKPDLPEPNWEKWWKLLRV